MLFVLFLSLLPLQLKHVYDLGDIHRPGMSFAKNDNQDTSSHESLSIEMPLAKSPEWGPKSIPSGERATKVLLEALTEFSFVGGFV